ncbi:Bone morphogenetic protein receptor type-2 [Halotydeus destructor]|nr:Bone morphogenetic protein receptor type-2 [Halotydeus destructor]
MQTTIKGSDYETESSKSKPSTRSSNLSVGARMNSFLLIVLISAAINCSTASTESSGVESTICAYSNSRNIRVSAPSAEEEETELGFPEEEEPKQEWIDSGRQVCSKSHACYVVWKEIQRPELPLDGHVKQTEAVSNATIIILAQGCWESSSQSDCPETESCLSRRRPANGTRFCCCQDSMCNLNFTDNYNPANDTQYDLALRRRAITAVRESPTSLVAITIWTIFGVLFIMLITVALMTCKSHNEKNLLSSPDSNESHGSRSPLFDLDTLKVEDIIGQGRYGAVFKGALDCETVAVKVFSEHNKPYFVNERDIYMLPFMEHTGIPSFFGADERPREVNGSLVSEYRLVMSHAQHGCLQDYLRSNTVDWSTLCRMIQSMASALAYLHGEVRKGDKMKPCIVHRDLSSRNILVKDDRTVAICDYGFALKFSESRVVVNGVEQAANNRSLTEVGTLRYLAPEVLEGAVNLHDCEAALKQIDVYAMSLIMWEMASRCSELYQGMPVPTYKQPYEADLGSQPTYEQMQIAVTRQKSRPLFPDLWKDTNPAIRSLKETMTECWDHDGEARLTALCVEERLYELPILWERHRSALLCGHGSLPVPSANHAPNQRMNMLSLRNNATPNMAGDGFLLSNLATVNKVTNQLNQLSREVISGPPTEVAPQAEKNILNASIVNGSAQQQPQYQITFPLQPYQGRNPCLERNLMQSQSDEGNHNLLLEQGFKFRDSNNFLVNSASTSWSDQASDTRCLVPRNVNSNDTIVNIPVQRRLPVPITIQNAISSNHMPKQHNLPGNGPREPLMGATGVADSSPSGQVDHVSLVTRLKKWAKARGPRTFANRGRSSDASPNETEPLSAVSSSSSETVPTSPTAEATRDVEASFENGSIQTRLINGDNGSYSEVSSYTDAKNVA